MATCDELLETLFLGGGLDGAAAEHLRQCASCQEEARVVRVLAQGLATGAVPAPPPGLTARVLRAAGPLLAARTRVQQQQSRRQLARAVVVALLPLPAILALNAYAVYAVYALLSALLPATLSVYLVFNYAALLVLLMTLTYGAVPLFADSQARLGQEPRFE
jgi:hypothetical protein